MNDVTISKMKKLPFLLISVDIHISEMLMIPLFLGMIWSLTNMNTSSPPATLHRLLNPKWLPGGPKMADEVWKEDYP